MILGVKAIIKLITTIKIIKNKNSIVKTDIITPTNVKNIRYCSHYLFGYEALTSYAIKY